MEPDAVSTTGNPYNQRFTIVPNFLIRKLAVSFEARMLLIYLMSHDTGYLLKVTQIISETGKGKDCIQRLMRELEDFGVLRRRQLRTAGRITGTVYEIIHDKIVNACAEPTRTEYSGPGPEQPEREFPQVTPEPGSPALVEPPTKKTMYEKTKEEDQKTAPATQSPHTAQTLLALLIDACSKQGVILPPRVKGMYAKKFKELLDGGVPDHLILEALRISWKKKTLDKVQLLDNFLIEVQAGERQPDVRTKQEVRNEGVDATIDRAVALVVARGGNPNNNKLVVKAMKEIRQGLVNVGNALTGAVQMELMSA